MSRIEGVPPGRTSGSVPLRVLVADSHEIIRKAVRTTLDAEPAWIVYAESTTGLETLAKVSEFAPDVVILDVNLPGLTALELTREIRRLRPDTHIVTLTMHASVQAEQRLQAAGAHATLTKADIGRSLVGAIRSFRALGIAADTTDSPLPSSGQTMEGSGAGSAASLTMRERQVMQLLAEGKSTKEVAAVLMISAKTVETYRGRIMSKLGLHSMNQLVRYAIRHRIINA